MLRRWIARTLLVSGALLAVAAFLTPLPGKIVLGPALSFLERQHGIVAAVGQFDLDLAQLRIAVEDLRLAARDRQTDPFVTVEPAMVDLSWTAIWNGLAIEDASLNGMVVSVVRRPDGSSNLPGGASGTEAAPAPNPPRLPIRRLDVEDFTLDWRDEAAGFSLDLPGTSVHLVADAGSAGNASGPISVDGAGRISWRGTATEISRLDGEIGFDGVGLDISRLVLAAPEGNLALSGRVESLLGHPHLTLNYEAELDLARMATWLPDTTASGNAALTGDVSGPADDLTASGVLRSATVEWNGMAADRVDATVSVRPSAFSLDALRLELAEGVLNAEGRVDRVAGWPGRLDATWSGLGDPAWDLPQGHRTGNPVAASPGAFRLGGWHPHARHPSFEQAPRLKQGEADAALTLERAVRRTGVRRAGQRCATDW